MKEDITILEDAYDDVRQASEGGPIAKVVCKVSDCIHWHEGDQCHAPEGITLWNFNDRAICDTYKTNHDR